MLGLLAVLAAVVVVGCRTDVTVDIDVASDGSGTVTATAVLDAEAAGQVGAAENVKFDDLASAGWTVAEPTTVEGGAVRLRVSRRFGSPEQLPVVLAEIGGTDGVFRDVGLSIDDGFATTETKFTARVELTGTPEQFSDPQLTAALGNLTFGRTPEELEALGINAPGAASLDVRVKLPNPPPDTNGKVVGDRATWSFPLTGGTPTSQSLQASTTDRDATTLFLVAGGVALIVIGLAVAVVGLVRSRRA